MDAESTNDVERELSIAHGTSSRGESSQTNQDEDLFLNLVQSGNRRLSNTDGSHRDNDRLVRHIYC